MNLVDLLKRTSNYLKSRFPEKVNIKTSFKNHEVMVPVSEVLLHWVIKNICKNAVDAIKGNGSIEINLKEETLMLQST